MNEKESIPAKLADVIATFTENAQQAGQRKAKESGFDLDAGEIPFEETLINLTQNREVLSDAIKRGRISQIPLKLQYRLLADATKVKTQLDSLVGGTDAIVPFENAVEDLNATIWQLNLQNLSEQILGFDAKINDLKNQEALIKRVLREANRITEALESLSQKQTNAEHISNQIVETQAAISASQDAIARSLATASESEQKIIGLTSVAEAHEASIASSLATSRDSAAIVEAIKKESQERADEIRQVKDSYATLESQVQELLSETKDQIKLDVEDLGKTAKAIQDEMQTAEELRNKNSKEQLFDSASTFATTLETMQDHYKEQFKAIETKSTETIDKNDKEAIRLTDYLAELEARIHKSIERATGFSLFHAFQNRQSGLRQSTKWWAIGLGACVLVSACVSMWLIHSITTAPAYGPLFFMKLAISIPLVFAITFCSVQYSRERRLEEEYAFKSSISISLKPYRKLVGELIDKNQPTEVAKYTEFLINSINRVFTSPTAQVFDGDDLASKDAGGLLKTAGSVAESLIKAKLK